MTPKEKGCREDTPIPSDHVCQDDREFNCSPTRNQDFLAIHAMNARESLRTELLERHGRKVIRIGRWKPDREGALHPAGLGIEFSIDHIDGIAALIAATKLSIGGA